MNAPAIIEAERLPAMVREAAQRLAAAETCAEVLTARDMAHVAYDTAKIAARLAKAKMAHDQVCIAAMRAQADALDIESAAKRRLASEYDAAQERGEVRTRADNQYASSGREEAPSAADIGLTHKEIHEARQLRDAEEADPGVTRRTIDRLLDEGREPTRAAVRREIAAAPPKPKPECVTSPESLWLWGRLLDFERDGILTHPIPQFLAKMTVQMRSDVRRLTPLVREFLEELEVACDNS